MTYDPIQAITKAIYNSLLFYRHDQREVNNTRVEKRTDFQLYFYVVFNVFNGSVLYNLGGPISSSTIISNIYIHTFVLMYVDVGFVQYPTKKNLEGLSIYVLT